MAETAIPADACQLYRHFDVQGDLLYVGMSLSAVGRLSKHKTEAKWFAKIARMEVQTFPSREQAAKAEAEAIISENPRYNIAGRNRLLVARGRALPIRQAVTSAERQRKWRDANPDLARKRAREGMRKRRATAKAT